MPFLSQEKIFIFSSLRGQNDNRKSSSVIKGWFPERDMKSVFPKRDTKVYFFELGYYQEASRKPKKTNAGRRELASSSGYSSTRNTRVYVASSGATYQSSNKILWTTFLLSPRKCLYQKSLFIIPSTSEKCHLVLWNLTFLYKFILMKSLAFSWGFFCLPAKW